MSNSFTPSLKPYGSILILLFLLLGLSNTLAQTTKKLSKFDAFNKKAERLFKILPVPLYSKSSEAGDIFGIAKYNLWHLKNDTLSQPSRLAEVITVSTKGRINASVSNDLIFSQGKYMLLSFLNFKHQPEYIFGIGNDVSINDVEQIEFSRLKFSSTFVRKSLGKFGYGGISVDVSNYFNMKLDSNSFILRDNLDGKKGGKNIGLGLSIAWDSRDNRYNAHKGMFTILTFLTYSKAVGSDYAFSKIDFDARKYFNPWLKHVIAIQTTTTYCFGDVPFYEFAMLGGEDKMRGYYRGALRDRTLIDAQVEYRLPIWNIFGLVTWVGTGQVASSYSKVSFNDLWLSYGLGLRVRVDSENNSNLRFDMGFGPGGISGFYINFAEAF